ncbi:hypothetical protein [Paraburkholderia sp. JPY419]|uniref:hypothetical protein n=1 Tax=Paraburkholderia sp. JPY419 TaxID=667660 RepID=UPI003D1EA1C8
MIVVQYVGGLAEEPAHHAPQVRAGNASAFVVAVLARPSLRQKHISPHVIKHATATHLLQAGVDISVIALWLVP